MGFDVEAAVAAIKANVEQEKLQVKQRKLKAATEGKRIANLLKEKDPSILHIYGFGSVFFKGSNFSRYSDIDLALEGGYIFSLISTVEQSEFKIDLIDITGAYDSFAENIRTNGKLLV